MNKILSAILIGGMLTVGTSGIAFATDTVEEVKIKADNANSKADGNNSRVQGLEAMVSDLQAQIDALALQQGPKGDKGDKGDTGKQGSQGLPGADGANGTNGVDGQDGTDGINGLSCWDLDDDDSCDANDDVNGDGFCDLLDCQPASSSKAAVMYLKRNVQGSPYAVPTLCPVGWTEADLTRVDTKYENYMVRTCYNMDNSCTVIEFERTNPGGTVPMPPLCPTDWVEAGLNTNDISSRWVRTCFYCSQ